MMFQDLLKTWREVDAQWRDLYKLCRDKTVPEDRHAVNMLNLDIQEEVLGYAAMALSVYLWGKFSKQTHALHVRVGIGCCVVSVTAARRRKTRGTRFLSTPYTP